ncbi:BatA domain-containing protein, partial [Brucella melitensis]|uniref:BatA domain-containing protein n=1 Tax=Brucella melitensis TaxID=29459 RepID=UPI0004AA59E4
MNFLPLAFGSPLILAGLIALPVIWWLLRMTPPRPQEETFPPLRILAQVFRREEVPSKSPWWMTLLRLLIAGLVILALASPIWNPRPLALPGNEPLAIVIDNGWGF